MELQDSEGLWNHRQGLIAHFGTKDRLVYELHGFWAKDKKEENANNQSS